MSEGDGRRGFRSQDTRQSSSFNIGFYRCGDQSGDDGRGGYRYQETSNSSSRNHGSRVDICLRPATIPLITQVDVVHFWVYHFILFHVENNVHGDERVG